MTTWKLITGLLAERGWTTTNDTHLYRQNLCISHEFECIIIWQFEANDWRQKLKIGSLGDSSLHAAEAVIDKAMALEEER